MCSVIINGKDVIEYVKDLKTIVNDIVIDRRYKTASDNDCLCTVDIPATLQKAGIDYIEANSMEYYIVQKRDKETIEE